MGRPSNSPLYAATAIGLDETTQRDGIDEFLIALTITRLRRNRDVYPSSTIARVTSDDALCQWNTARSMHSALSKAKACGAMRRVKDDSQVQLPCYLQKPLEPWPRRRSVRRDPVVRGSYQGNPTSAMATSMCVPDESERSRVWSRHQQPSALRTPSPP